MARLHCICQSIDLTLHLLFSCSVQLQQSYIAGGMWCTVGVCLSTAVLISFLRCGGAGERGERRNSYCGDQVCDGEDSEIRDDSDSILLSEAGRKVLLQVLRFFSQCSHDAIVSFHAGAIESCLSICSIHIKSFVEETTSILYLTR